MSFWASELHENNWGWEVVNGTCGGHTFKLGKGGQKTCEELLVRVDMATASFSAGGNWSVTVSGGRSYATEGPEHRLDVGIVVRGDFAARNLPHGIFGQSFSSPLPRQGNVDIYPEAGRFTTTAMAEGALDGDASMYEVPSPYATDFKFSRFDAEPLATPVPALLLADMSTAVQSDKGSKKDHT